MLRLPLGVMNADLHYRNGSDVLPSTSAQYWTSMEFANSTSTFKMYYTSLRLRMSLQLSFMEVTTEYTQSQASRA